MPTTDASHAGLRLGTKEEGQPPPDLQLIKTKLVTRRRPPLSQRLAVFYYAWSFGYWTWIWSTVLVLVFLFPPLLLPVAVYTAYICGPGARPSYDASWPTPWRTFHLWKLVTEYFDARLHKTADLPPGRPYLFAHHPHGVVCYSGWLGFAAPFTGFPRLFPGIDVRVLTLTINFRAPLLREYLLLQGVCDVSRSSCLRILGNGKSIWIAVGGGTESLYAKPGANDIVLARRKGFVRVALLSGAALVPCYAFGENNVFRTVNELPPRFAFVRRAQRWMEKKTGFTVPLVFGTGLLTSFGLLPYPVQLNTVVGAPIDVPKFEGDEASAEFAALVDKYHAVYVKALRQLFEDHRERFAKGEADLRIVE